MKRSVFAVILVMSMVLGACSSNSDKINEGSVTPAPTSVQENITQTVTEPVVTEEPEVPYEGKTMTFDTGIKYQTWEGFGAAYTWYGDRLLNAQNAEEGLDYLFTDAKLTILRLKNEYEYTIPGKATNATAMARNYKEARDRAAQYGERVQVLLCCWSPPAKLKSDNAIDTGTGTLKKDGNGNYIYGEYAKWWTESVKYYRSKGIAVDYVSIQNEVDFSPADYEGCRFDAKENNNYAGYAEAFCAVYDAFKAEFGDDAPILIGPETMGCETSQLRNYIRTIESINPEALGGLAFHLYASGTSDSSTMTVKPTSYFTAFAGLHDFFGGMRKWQTEFYIGQGIQTAELIINAINDAEITAYLYWSGVWDDSTPNRFDSADLIEINSKGEWRTSANYWTMRHFSEFIRPGYIRIDANSDDGKVKATAFTNENGTKVAAVLINRSEQDVEYRVLGTDYTITDSSVYQSVFGDGASEASMHKSLGSLGEGGTITLPAYSVTSVDITGYEGDTKAEVPAVEVITYDDDILTEEIANFVPDYDVVILNSDFSDDSQTSLYSGFGSSIARRVADGGADGTGCLIVKGRADTWNGIRLSEGYFEHYGYLVKVSYDVMMMNDTATVSCTSTFTVDSSTYYPDGEKNRIACHDLKAGEWKHAEGYATMYTNMNDGSFSLYWESPDNTDDIYLDNIQVTVMYTMPAGEYEQ